ncbi:MAG: DEAD/DEAH box helicase [Clostridia bacterium]|nr:DEAD/DEAH box helicase [Clostridia bacterium]
MLFEDMNLNEEIKKVLKQKNFKEATEIQQKAIPIIQSGGDVVGLSQTGTGKTLAFVLPMLEKIEKDNFSVQALILCPTRELAGQIKQEVKEYSLYLNYVSVLAVYGGADIKQQIFSLKRRPKIIVGTPGRVLDHIKRHTLKLQNVKMLVLDEADEMFNMGFRNDIINIIQKTPENRQTLLFSATMNEEVLNISKDYMLSPQIIRVGGENKAIESVKQTYFLVPKDKKKKALHSLLKEIERGRTLIFCNTKNMVGVVQSYLGKMGYRVAVLHGDMPQSQRTNVMREYKSGKVEILITTDVSARGIDVNDVLHVVNYDLPQNLEYYIHRIGRTGRAGKTGYAWTILNSEDQQKKLKQIEKLTKSKIEYQRLQLANIDEIQEENNFKGQEKSKSGARKGKFNKKFSKNSNIQKKVDNKNAKPRKRIYF